MSRSEWLAAAISWIVLKILRWLYVGKEVAVVSVSYPGIAREWLTVDDVVLSQNEMCAVFETEAQRNIVPLTMLVYDPIWKTYVWCR